MTRPEPGERHKAMLGTADGRCGRTVDGERCGLFANDARHLPEPGEPTERDREAANVWLATHLGPPRMTPRQVEALARFRAQARAEGREEARLDRASHPALICVHSDDGLCLSCQEVWDARVVAARAEGAAEERKACVCLLRLDAKAEFYDMATARERAYAGSRLNGAARMIERGDHLAGKGE